MTFCQLKANTSYETKPELSLFDEVLEQSSPLRFTILWIIKKQTFFSLLLDCFFKLLVAIQRIILGGFYLYSKIAQHLCVHPGFDLLVGPSPPNTPTCLPNFFCTCYN